MAQQITFIDPGGRTHVLQVEPGQSVMQVAIEHDVPGILADCGGSCSCATCHCYVDAAWADRLPAASAAEAELVSYAFDPEPCSRLACQLLLEPQHDGIVIRLPQRQI